MNELPLLPLSIVEEDGKGRRVSGVREGCGNRAGMGGRESQEDQAIEDQGGWERGERGVRSGNTEVRRTVGMAVGHTVTGTTKSWYMRHKDWCGERTRTGRAGRARPSTVKERTREVVRTCVFPGLRSRGEGDSRRSGGE
jgi:hypothetical protein